MTQTTQCYVTRKTKGVPNHSLNILVHLRCHPEFKNIVTKCKNKIQTHTLTVSFTYTELIMAYLY